MPGPAGWKPGGIVTRGIHGAANDANEKNQHPFAARNPVAGDRLRHDGPHQNLDQSQPAPGYQYEAPVLDDDVHQRNLRPEISQQKQSANPDENQRPNYGTPSHIALPPVGPESWITGLATTFSSSFKMPNRIMRV